MMTGKYKKPGIKQNEKKECHHDSNECVIICSSLFRLVFVCEIVTYIPLWNVFKIEDDIFSRVSSSFVPTNIIKETNFYVCKNIFVSIN